MYHEKYSHLINNYCICRFFQKFSIENQKIMKSAGLPFILFFVFCSMLRSQNINVFQEWATREGTQNHFIKAAVTTDFFENVYVAGATLNAAGDYDMLVTKYDGSGDVVWTSQYGGTAYGDDIAFAIALDANGKVFVTGSVWSGAADSNDVITIAYDNQGSQDWVEIFDGSDGGNDAGTCIVLDADTVYIGGFVSDSITGPDFLCLKYKYDNTLLWNATYDEDTTRDIPTQFLSWGFGTATLGGGSISGISSWEFLSVRFNADDGSYNTSYTSGGASAAFGMVNGAVKDNSGNIYLTGMTYNVSSGFDVLTVKLASDLSLTWSKTWKSGGAKRECGNGIALDASGNVYVCGYSDSTTKHPDFVTIKYNSSGTEQWEKFWNGSADSSDTAKAVIVDTYGDIIVTGSSMSGDSDFCQLNFLTVKYDASGNELWEIEYDNEFRLLDSPDAIAIDTTGNVIVAGHSLLPDTTLGYTTVKYVEVDVIQVPDTDSVAGKIPFIANNGQLADTGGAEVDFIRFYEKQHYPGAYYMDDTVVFVFSTIDGDTATDDTLHRIDMHFAGNPGVLYPVDPESYHHNYYRSHIPEGRRLVPLYKGFYRPEVWEKIDIHYASNQAGLQYQFIVKPATDPFGDGGNPADIVIEFFGYDSLFVNSGDSLVVRSLCGDLLFPPPRMWQIDGNGDFEGMGDLAEFVVNGNEVTFTGIGEYDSEKKLVISFEEGVGQEQPLTPVILNLLWSTYVGSVREDVILDVKRTPQEEYLICGWEHDGSSLLQDVGYNIGNQNLLAKVDEGFVALFNTAREAVWITYVGGNDSDMVTSVAYNPFATSSQGEVIACGYTDDFIATTPGQPGSNAYVQSQFSGGKDAFVMRCKGQTGLLTYSEMIGGSGDDFAYGVVANSYGDYYLTGTSTSQGSSNNCNATVNSTFPLCDPGGSSYFQSFNAGGGDIFMMRFNNANQLLWSTFYGSDKPDMVYDMHLQMDEESQHAAGPPTNPTIFICGKTEKTSDPQGNYTTAQAQANGDFPLFDPSGNTDYFQVGYGAYIARFEYDGILVWASNFNGIEEFQTVAANEDHLYAVGLQTGSGVIGCTPMSNNDIPVCTTATGYVNVSGTNQIYIAKLDAGNQQLKWSTLYGYPNDMQPRDDYPYFEWGYTAAWQYIDAACTSDDDLFIFGVAVEDVPAYLDNSISSWFYDIDNNQSAYKRPDTYILYFNGQGERLWATHFGGDHWPNYPFTTQPGLNNEMSDWASGVSVYKDKLVIAGHAGGIFQPTFPFITTTDNFPITSPGGNAYIQQDVKQLWLTNNVNSDGFIAEFDVNYIIVPIEEKNGPGSQSMLLYPNPAESFFSIESRDVKGSFDLEIYDMQGRKILSFPGWNLSNGNVNVATLNPGFYLVKLRGNGWNESLKLIKL